MKKSIIVILVLLLSLFLMSCEETITEKATITLDVNGGNALDTRSIKFNLGQKISLDDLVIPTKAKDTDKHIKYTFLGWATDDDTIVVDNEKEYTITKDETLKALWDEVNYYTVSYNLDGGIYGTANSIDSKIVNENDGIPTLVEDLLKPTDTYGHYEFKYWLIVGAGTDGADLQLPTDYEVTSDITLKAVWTSLGHKVIYKLDDGAIDGSTADIVKYVKTGESISNDNMPSTPEKDNYKFSHWYYGENVTFTNSTVIIRDMEVYAAYTKIHTVIFNLDGGTYNSSSTMESEKVDDYDTFTAPTTNLEKPQTPSQTFLFDKWVIVEEGQDDVDYTPSYQVTKDITLKAIWTETTRQYTIIYNLDGGTYNGTTSIFKEIDYNSDIPTLTGTLAKDSDVESKEFAFSKWLLVGEGDDNTDIEIPTGYKVTKDITLKAVWVESTSEYTITYDLDGGTYNGSTTIDSVDVEYNNTFIPPSDTLAKEPTSAKTFTFSKWIIVEEGKNNVDYSSSYQVTNDITLKAVWTETTRKYKVTFDYNGGKHDGKDSSVVEYSYNSNFNPSNIPTKTDYVIDRWEAEDESGNKVTYVIGQTKITREVTVKAIWVEAVHSVTFKLDGGSVNNSTSDISVNVDHAKKMSEMNLALPDNPVKEGYVFDKWCVVIDNVEGAKFGIYTKINSDTEVKAIYKPLYTVTFNLLDGMWNDRVTSVIDIYAEGATLFYRKNLIDNSASVTLNIVNGNNVHMKPSSGWTIDGNSLKDGEKITTNSTISPVFIDRPDGNIAPLTGTPVTIIFDLGPTGCYGLVKRTITYYVQSGENKLFDDIVPTVAGFSHWLYVTDDGTEITNTNADLLNRNIVQDMTFTAVYNPTQ